MAMRKGANDGGKGTGGVVRTVLSLTEKQSSSIDDRRLPSVCDATSFLTWESAQNVVQGSNLAEVSIMECRRSYGVRHFALQS